MQKYLFLLKHETFLAGDSAFYDFLPHKFGPYSFAANREIESLTSYGYVHSCASASVISLTAAPIGEKEAIRSDSDTSRVVRFIVSKYGGISARSLMKDVYTRYPWFAVNSELTELIPADAPRPKAAPLAIYTMGYEQRSVDQFFNRLLEVGVRNVVDTRANPVSRKYGFARSSLSSIANKLGLGYSHYPGLGIPSKQRSDVASVADFRTLFEHYETVILPAHEGEIESVATQMKSTPSVLVCMEKEAVDCHRSRLARRIAEMTELPTVHL